jgi:hypothetical protein
MNIGTLNTKNVVIGRNGVTTYVNGPLTVSGLITSGPDRVMSIGTDASGITIGQVGATTTFQGPITVSGLITSGANRVITIGASDSSGIIISREGVTTYVNGPLTVSGLITSGPKKFMSIGTDCSGITIGRSSITTTINGKLKYTEGVPEFVASPADLTYINATYRFTLTSQSPLSGDTTFLYLSDIPPGKYIIHLVVFTTSNSLNCEALYLTIYQGTGTVPGPGTTFFDQRYRYLSGTTTTGSEFSMTAHAFFTLSETVEVRAIFRYVNKSLGTLNLNPGKSGYIFYNFLHRIG